MRAASSKAIGSSAKKALKSQIAKRQVEGQVGNDESLDGVEEVKTSKHDVQRNDDGSDRGHSGANNPEGKMFFAGEMASGQPVAGKHAENDRDKGRDACC